MGAEGDHVAGADDAGRQGIAREQGGRRTVAVAPAASAGRDAPSGRATACRAKDSRAVRQILDATIGSHVGTANSLEKERYNTFVSKSK